ncbi:apolipoprotein D-like [Mya arenaria]|uniref:apolipoprotein D-like n=1 Tax=Mya arenaria TaxID=6604 RepID=UPI0022DF4393|nr:apolipoprotein D-like [Mya arenaria]
MIFVLLVLSFSLRSVSSQVPLAGTCPKVEGQEDFDLDKYYGTWYEITKFYTSFENGQKCNTVTYSPKLNGHIEIFNEGFDKEYHEINTTDDAYIPDKTEKSTIKVQFSQGAPYSDYWILDTDYATYSLIFSCINISDVSHLEYSWILARKPLLDHSVRKRLYQKLESFKVDTKHFIDDDQSSCYWSIN